MAKIEKGEAARQALLAEVEALFELNQKEREVVELQAYIATIGDEQDWTYEKFFDVCRLSSVKIAGQPLRVSNYLDEDGCPDGGFSEACGLQIRWQRGPCSTDEDETPWNGCFLVTVLEAAKAQLEFYQSTKFACESNEEALAAVDAAISVLNRRQIERFTRGVRNKKEE